MKKLVLLVIAATVVAVPGMVWAQVQYPTEVLERYWECRERNDLDEIQQLLWYHHNVERIDASIYGLPRDDFDDRALLTIDERYQYRAEKARQVEEEGAVPLPTSGEVQYPHYLREALDHYYESTGQRPDCSRILAESGVELPEPEVMGSAWASDHNLTSADSVDRGEVNIVVDRANPNRVLVSSCPGQGAVDPTSNFVAYTSNWGQTWTRTSNGNNSGSAWECDPVSYYQRSTGRVYHAKIGCNTGSCGATYAMMRYSANNGSTWADCGRPGVDTSEDREWHTVDNTQQYDANGDGTPDTANACYGTIYVTWHNSNQEKVARSTDNCATWVNRTDLTAVSQAITPDLNTAADGHVYVVWQNHGDATFKIAGSTNCGVTWNAPSASTVKTRLGNWSNAIPAQCVRNVATQPLVDVDRAPRSAFYGRVYVAMLDFNQSGCGSGPGCSTWNSTCNFDVWLTYSDDHGTTWHKPSDGTAGVDDITVGDGNLVDNFMGYMRVDESDGSLYMTYHRTRLNPTALVDRQKTYEFVMRSTNGGRNWETYQASTLEGDERVSGASTFERGDYNAVDVYQGVVWPVWIDRRNTSAEEEIITRKVCTEPAHWTERAPTYAAPTIGVVNGTGAARVDVTWAAPDIHWGDGGENNALRKYQLWVDGSLAQDNILWTSTMLDEYNIGNCNSHQYVLRAINECGVYKDYATMTFAATNCCANDPTSVNVTPDGPLTVCQGTSVVLTATPAGGSGPFTYQWYRDGGVIGGATSPTYTAGDTGSHSYNCEVTGPSCASGTQDGAATQITWQVAPTFAGLQSVTNPQSSTCTLNLSWNLATSACAGPLVYNVYRSTTSGFTPGAGNRIAAALTCSGSPCSYSDADSLASGTPYYYVVRAVDQSNGAEDSNMVEKSGTPTGPSSIAPWSDDLEPSPDAGWTHAAAQGADDWTLSTAASHSATHSWASADVATITDKWVVIPAKNLTASSVLTFWHQYSFEVGSGTTGYDGGVIEISTNGGSGWTDLGASITAGGYTHTIATGWGNPLGGRQAWSGAQTSFVQVTANLGSYAGSGRLVRWRMGCDNSTAGGTWYVDDIQITNVDTPGTCTTGGGSQADLGVTKSDGLTQAVPGQSLTYTIVVSNTGPSAVTGATVADTFPAVLTGVSWTCTGSGGGTCAASGSGNISTTANLPVSASVTYVASGTITASATGTLSNTATVTAPAGVTDPSTGNNSATDTDTLTPQANLGVTKTDGASTAVPGQAVTYTIVVSNTGPSAVTGATVADTFPAVLTGVSWTCTGSGGGTCAASGSGNISTTANLPVSASVTYVASGTITASATGTLSNTATVTAPAGVTDPSTGNNSSTDTDTLVPTADLALTATDAVTAAVPGQSVTYTIAVTNAGGPSEVLATVNDVFPTALTGVTWTCVGAGGGSCAASGSGTLADAVSLPVGGSVTYTAAGTVDPGASGTLADTAAVTVPIGTTDPNPANNSATDTDTLTPLVDLAVTNSDFVCFVLPGQSTTYTITAWNVGPSTAAGAIVSDPFPAALTNVTWTCSGSGGGTCAASGSGTLDDAVTLPPGGRVVYSATGTVVAGATGLLVNAVTVAPPAGTTDTGPTNNSAADWDALETPLFCDGFETGDTSAWPTARAR